MINCTLFRVTIFFVQKMTISVSILAIYCIMVQCALVHWPLQVLQINDYNTLNPAGVHSCRYKLDIRIHSNKYVVTLM